MPLPFYNYFIILSCLASITVFFQRRSPLFLKLFPYFLILTFLVEIGNYLLVRYTGSNLILSNSYTIIQFSFYLFALKEIISGKTAKKIMVYMIGSFLIFSLV